MRLPVTMRFLVLSLGAGLLVLIGFGSAFALSFGPDLLSQHSRPALHVPAKMVAVVPGGKTFHDPMCKYMHGTPEMMAAEEAVRKGYSPCVRCMHEALQEKR